MCTTSVREFVSARVFAVTFSTVFHTSPQPLCTAICATYNERLSLQRDRLKRTCGRVQSDAVGFISRLFEPVAIGYARTPYQATAEVPKGPGTKHEADGVIEILPEFAEGLTDIEGFSHLFVIWTFHRADGCELLAQPPGETTTHGVFATRSPRRPNPIALTVVELQRREGTRLFVHGVDMLDGTPILDIKPYLSSIPMQSLRRGWLDLR